MIGIRPILILGPPGMGKSRLARRVAEELRIPHVMSDLTREWGVVNGLFPEVHAGDLGGVPKNVRELRLLCQDYLLEWVLATLGPNRALH